MAWRRPDARQGAAGPRRDTVRPRPPRPGGDARAAPQPDVTVKGEGIRVQGTGEDVGVAEARSRFGGVDAPATLAGTAAAVGTVVVVGGLVAGVGTIGFQLGLEGDDTLSLAGLVAGLVTLALGFWVGGWVAGRMARYDGGRNGLLTALWFVVLAALTSGLAAALGSSFDVFSDLRLPQWFSRNALTPAAVASGLLAFAVMVAAGWLGGQVGERYHRSADALIANTRQGGVARPQHRMRRP
ncbi:MAG: YrzE family protein [Actinomycetota bacterium]|nr:YrzE family protein [Actinomycetota bacterium]